jgi:hypothetical protein
MFGAPGAALILRWPFHVVYDQDLNRAFSGA